MVEDEGAAGDAGRVGSGLGVADGTSITMARRRSASLRRIELDRSAVEALRDDDAVDSHPNVDDVGSALVTRGERDRRDGLVDVDQPLRAIALQGTRARARADDELIPRCSELALVA